MSLPSPLRLAPMALAWALAAGIAFATLCPQSLRPHLASAQVERFSAYFVTAGVFVLAYPNRPRAIAAGAVAVAILLELAQLISPGRDAGVPDAISKASGGVCGVLVAAAAMAIARRYIVTRPSP